jgi:hypothetical protein
MLPGEDPPESAARVVFSIGRADPATSIYRYDREAFRARIPYFAEHRPGEFSIWVALHQEQAAWDIVARIRGKRSVFEPAPG